MKITSDEEHAEAFKQADKLWGTKPGTPEYEKWEELVLALDEYESVRWPMD